MTPWQININNALNASAPRTMHRIQEQVLEYIVKNPRTTNESLAKKFGWSMTVTRDTVSKLRSKKKIKNLKLGTGSPAVWIAL